MHCLCRGEGQVDLFFGNGVFSVWGLYHSDIDNLHRPEESNKKKHYERWFNNECFAWRKILTELSNKKVNIAILLMKL